MFLALQLCSSGFKVHLPRQKSQVVVLLRLTSVLSSLGKYIKFMRRFRSPLSESCDYHSPDIDLPNHSASSLWKILTLGKGGSWEAAIYCTRRLPAVMMSAMDRKRSTWWDMLFFLSVPGGLRNYALFSQPTQREHSGFDSKQTQPILKWWIWLPWFDWNAEKGGKEEIIIDVQAGLRI